MASWTDGLITAGSSTESLQSVTNAYRDGGGDGKPLMLQAAICHGATQAEASAAAHRLWRHAALDAESIANLSTPKAFDEATENIKPQQLDSRLRISSDLVRLFDEIHSDAELGFDCVYVHYIGHHVAQFIERFGNLIQEVAKSPSKTTMPF
jgi:hypothetical protein